LSVKPDIKQWLAHFSAEFISIDSSTRLGRTSHYGPLRVQRPFFPEGNDLQHLYLLHPPGGLVGGDQLSIDLKLGPKTRVLMTTPSAGKFYRNITAFDQGQHVCLKVADGASLEWLPMENIIFSGASAHLSTQVELQGDGIFIGWEITCLGRKASNETFSSGSLKQTLTISRDGQLLFKDRLHLKAASLLQTSRAGLQDKSVFGSFVITSDPDFDYGEFQQTINEKIAPGFIAITQKKNVLIARVLADNGEDARFAFESLWETLRPLVLNRKSCPPRIWNT